MCLCCLQYSNNNVTIQPTANHLGKIGFSSLYLRSCVHKDTLLEVKDDRLLYERACDVLESFMRRVLIDIVISVFLGVKLNNEAMRETFLSTSSGVSREKKKSCFGRILYLQAFGRVVFPSCYRFDVARPGLGMDACLLETEHSQGDLVLLLAMLARLSSLGLWGCTSLRCTGVASSLNLKRTMWVTRGTAAVCGWVLNEVWRNECR